jgi:antitoxin ParD1/3/4
MPTRNVVLTEHQADLVERLVDSGRYQNASEVLREGLRMVENRETEERARLKLLRQAVRVGAADISSGRFSEHDSSRSLKTSLGKRARAAVERSKIRGS